VSRPDPIEYLRSARSRSLTPADLVRIDIREEKALAKAPANDNAANSKAVRHG
jgi:hypothetical protein